MAETGRGGGEDDALRVSPVLQQATQRRLTIFLSTASRLDFPSCRKSTQTTFCFRAMAEAIKW